MPRIEKQLIQELIREYLKYESIGNITNQSEIRDVNGTVSLDLILKKSSFDKKKGDFMLINENILNVLSSQVAVMDHPNYVQKYKENQGNLLIVELLVSIID